VTSELGIFVNSLFLCFFNIFFHCLLPFPANKDVYTTYVAHYRSVSCRIGLRRRWTAVGIESTGDLRDPFCSRLKTTTGKLQ